MVLKHPYNGVDILNDFENLNLDNELPYMKSIIYKFMMLPMHHLLTSMM